MNKEEFKKLLGANFEEITKLEYNNLYFIGEFTAYCENCVLFFKPKQICQKCSDALEILDKNIQHGLDKKEEESKEIWRKERDKLLKTGEVKNE